MEAATATETKPPYGGFRTFWNFIQQLHEQRPLPQRLDRSVMGSRGGSSRAELYTALRFFGLIDSEKAPTEALERVAGDPTPGTLLWLVESQYAPLIALDLTTATPRQVDETLLAMGSTASTVQRARTFFLNAAEETGLEVGRTLKTARAPTSGTARRRPRQKPKPTDEEPTSTVNEGLPPLVKALISKMPSEKDGWDETRASQWLDLMASSIAFDYGLDLDRLKRGGS